MYRSSWGAGSFWRVLSPEGWRVATLDDHPDVFSSPKWNSPWNSPSGGFKTQKNTSLPPSFLFLPQLLTVRASAPPGPHLLAPYSSQCGRPAVALSTISVWVTLPAVALSTTSVWVTLPAMAMSTTSVSVTLPTVALSTTSVWRSVFYLECWPLPRAAGSFSPSDDGNSECSHAWAAGNIAAVTAHLPICVNVFPFLSVTISEIAQLMINLSAIFLKTAKLSQWLHHLCSHQQREDLRLCLHCCRHLLLSVL